MEANVITQREAVSERCGVAVAADTPLAFTRSFVQTFNSSVKHGIFTFRTSNEHSSR